MSITHAEVREWVEDAAKPWRAEVERLTAAVRAAQSELTEARAERDNATRVVTEQAARIATLEATVRAAATEAGKLLAERDSLKAQLAEAQKELHAAYLSRSEAWGKASAAEAQLGAMREALEQIRDSHPPGRDAYDREAAFRKMAAAALSASTPKAEPDACPKCTESPLLKCCAVCGFNWPTKAEPQFADIGDTSGEVLTEGDGVSRE